MPTYRKKPIEIEAVHWDGSAEEAGPIIDWILSSSNRTARYRDDEPCIVIDTLEGMMAATPGDWIIQGVQGEFYPCKPDIFKATYDEVAEPEEEKGE